MPAANITPRLHWWNGVDSGKEKYPKKKVQGQFSSFFLRIHRLSLTSIILPVLPTYAKNDGGRIVNVMPDNV